VVSIHEVKKANLELVTEEELDEEEREFRALRRDSYPKLREKEYSRLFHCAGNYSPLSS
jgi:hypothetical protein